MECTRHPIPIRADILTQLANVLAELYSDQAGARTTDIDTRLNLTRISYCPRVIDMWIELLKKADAQDCTKTVLTQAKKDKSTYKSLLSAYQVSSDWVAINQSTKEPAYTHSRRFCVDCQFPSFSPVIHMPPQLSTQLYLVCAAPADKTSIPRRFQLAQTLPNSRCYTVAKRLAEDLRRVNEAWLSQQDREKAKKKKDDEWAIWQKDKLEEAYLAGIDDVVARFALAMSSCARMTIKTLFEDR